VYSLLCNEGPCMMKCAWVRPIGVAWGGCEGWADVSCQTHSAVTRRLRYVVWDFPLFPGLASATDIGMVGRPGYEVERRSVCYAFSILFSREFRGWVFDALCWHRKQVRMRDCVAEVERDKLFSLPEDERRNFQLEHGDLSNRERVQVALEPES